MSMQINGGELMHKRYLLLPGLFILIFAGSVYPQEVSKCDSAMFNSDDSVQNGLRKNNTMYSYDAIQQALSNSSSVAFEYGLTSAYSTHGGEIYHNRIFVDEVPVYSPYRFGLIWGRGMNFINASIIQDALFVNDNVSVRYGNYLSSVVRLNTTALLPETRIKVFINPFDTGISISESQFDSRLRYMISYSRSIINTSVNLFHKYPGYPKSFQLNNKITFQLNNDQKIGLLFHASSNKTDMLNSHLTEFKPFSNSSLNLVILNYCYTRNKLIHDLKISYQSNHLDYILGVSQADSLFDYKSKSAVIFLRDEYQYYFSELNNLKLGFDYTYFKPEMKFNPIIYDIYFGRTGLTDYLRFKTNHHTFGLYTEANLNLSDKLNSTVGLRYDHSELLGKADVSPRLSLNYRASDNIRLGINYAKYVQYPSGISLFDYLIPVDLNNVQSRSIGEMSECISLTAEIDIAKFWSINMNKYFKKDLVYWNSNGFDAKPVYQIDKNIDGFDIESHLNYKKLIGFSMAYSYLDADRDLGNQMKSVPVLLKHKHQYVMTLFVNMFKPMEISMNYRYASGPPIKQPPLYFVGYHNGYSYNINHNQVQYLPSAERLDIRFQYPFKAKSYKGMIFCEVLNVFNHVNIYDYAWHNDGVSEDGVNFSGNIYKYQIHNLGLLPVMGFEIQF